MSDLKLLVASINKILSRPVGATSSSQEVIRLGDEIITTYEPSSATHDATHEADDLKPLLNCLCEDGIAIETEIIYTKVIKILLRKASNRVALGKAGVVAIVTVLRRQTNRRPAPGLAAAVVAAANAIAVATTDICNVVLNASYLGINTEMLVEEGGVPPLLTLLRAGEPAVLASVLSAIQGICYIPTGRLLVRQHTEVRGLTGTGVRWQ